MKSFFITLLLPIFANAQTDTVLSFTEVVQVSGQSKEHLYMKARQWYNSVFTDLSYALRIADKETGELISKCKVRAPYAYKSFGKERILQMDYLLDFAMYVKDGRYKFVFYNFTSVDELFGGVAMNRDSTLPWGKLPIKIEKQKRVWSTMQEGLNKRMHEIIVDLKGHMANATVDSNF